jgi:hypothetical protein
MKAGTYHAWDCMHARYGWAIPDGQLPLESGFAHGEPRGRFDQSTMTELYRTLPGVTSVGYNGWAGEVDQLCATREGDVMHYVFSRLTADCPGLCSGRDYTHVTIDAAGTLVDVVTAKWSDGAPPAWVTRYASERCLR